jgi:hypothetical protein
VRSSGKIWADQKMMVWHSNYSKKNAVAVAHVNLIIRGYNKTMTEQTYTGCCAGCTCPDPHFSKPQDVTEAPAVNVQES